MFILTHCLFICKFINQGAILFITLELYFFPLNEISEARCQDNINVHTSPLHSYTLAMRKQTEIKETIPFTIMMKRIKYLGINLPKETKDLYIEN